MIDYSIIISIPLLYLLIRGLKVTFLEIKNYFENLKYRKRIQNSKPDFSKPIKIIGDDKNVYIFSTLGGCGSGSIKAICKNLDIKDLEINYILTLPFNWEGGKKYDKSMETLNFLRDHKSIITIFKNDNLLDYGNLNMKECFNKQNEEFNLLLFPNNLEW